MAPSSARVMRPKTKPPPSPRAAETTSLPMSKLRTPQKIPLHSFEKSTFGTDAEEQTPTADNISFDEWMARSSRRAKGKPTDRRALRHIAMDVASCAEYDAPLTTSSAEAQTSVMANMSAAKEAPSAGVAYHEPVSNPLTGRMIITEPMDITDDAAGRHELLGSPRRPGSAGGKGKSHQRGSGYTSIQMTRDRLLVAPVAAADGDGQWAVDRETAKGTMSMDEWVSAKAAPRSSKPTFGRQDSVWRHAYHGFDALTAHELPAAADDDETPGVAPAGLASTYFHRDVDPITWRPRPGMSPRSTPATLDRSRDQEETGLFRRRLPAAPLGSATSGQSRGSWMPSNLH